MSSFLGVIILVVFVGVMFLLDLLWQKVFKRELPDCFFYFSSIVTILALIVGWANNFVEVIKGANDPITVLYVIKCIGVFVFPLGALLGLFS